MAAVEVTITGVLYDKLARTTRPVVLIGEASLTGLEIGGGPLPGGPGTPPGIWGPNDPRPTPPIHMPDNPPGIWGPNDPRPTPPIHIPGNPPGIWGPGDGRPTPPIHIPPMPPDPPPDHAVKPPPEDGGWGYFPEYGWGYFPAVGEAGPK